jgi:hypothetical protein
MEEEMKPSCAGRDTTCVRTVTTRVLVCLLLGLGLAGSALTGCAGPSTHVRTATSTPAPASSPSARATTIQRPTSVDGSVLPMDRSLPVRLTMGRVGINAPLISVARAADGTVATPPFSAPHTAGWFDGSVTPGEQGTSVVVGHVDTRTGPAVFYPLSVTRPGDQISVQRADHSVADFTVDRIAVIARDAFDEGQVYGATGRPELRLITCGGTFNPATEEYSSNVVVYAHLTATHAG